MVEYFPAARLRANGSGIASEFSARIHDTLSLDDLVVLFTQLVALEGVVGHCCFAGAGDRRDFLFGLPAEDEAVEELRFRINGWDGEDYTIELALVPGAADDTRRAELHAMSALYVARGLALREAKDERSQSQLTQIEDYCLSQRRAGRSDLDIGEDIGRSVQAVQIYAARAERKLGSAHFGR